MASSILLNHERAWAVPFSQTRELGGLVLSCVSSFFSKEEFTDVTTLRSSSFKVKEYTWDKRGGTVHMQEKSEIIAGKCLGIFLALPIYTVLKIGFAVFNTMMQVAKIVKRVVPQVFWELYAGLIREGMGRLAQGTVEVMTAFGLGLWEVVKAPLFCVVGMFIAAYGVVSPYYGRRYFAKLENIWNCHSLYINELNVAKEINAKEEQVREEKGECSATCYGLSAALHNPYPRYLANCFQSRGTPGKDLDIVDFTPLRYCLQWLAS